MAFSERDKAAVRAIISVFETGKARGNPGAVAVLRDGAGISYGMHQATHKSGSLYKVVYWYCHLNGMFANDLTPYLPRLKNTAVRQQCAADDTLKRLLRQAGEHDPIMRQAQDAVFDRDYMTPAIDAVEGSGWNLPLSLAVVYDSHIHGGWKKVRDKVTLENSSEKEWITRYVTTREWHLANAGRSGSVFQPKDRRHAELLRSTVYRMDTFRALIKADNWQLTTPFVAHGVAVQEENL